MTKPLAFVIEDDPHLGQIYMFTLSASFEVEVITDGKQALARLLECAPQLVVLDINLPGASGVEILHAIRACASLNATRVIIASADARQADELQDKADIVLLKPISPKQLRELAERLK